MSLGPVLASRGSRELCDQDGKLAVTGPGQRHCRWSIEHQTTTRCKRVPTSNKGHRPSICAVRIQRTLQLKRQTSLYKMGKMTLSTR